MIPQHSLITYFMRLIFFLYPFKNNETWGFIFFILHIFRTLFPNNTFLGLLLHWNNFQYWYKTAKLTQFQHLDFFMHFVFIKWVSKEYVFINNSGIFYMYYKEEINLYIQGVNISSVGYFLIESCLWFSINSSFDLGENHQFPLFVANWNLEKLRSILRT